MFEGKKIVVGVCGSISAYITAEVVDWLKKNGAEVHVVMTEAATKFVTALTFQTLSGRPAAVNDYETGEEWYIPHITAAKDADLMLVMPATATTMSKVAYGMADNMVTATILAVTCPVYFAPTMNTNMYEKKTTQRNLMTLKELGYHIIEPDEGTMICGATGRGRMQTAEYLKNYIENVVQNL